MLPTQVTPAQTSQKRVIHVDVCGQSAHSKWKRCGADEVGRFFVTGATDAASKPNHFYCRICRKDVSVLTHGSHEVLGHFQGVKHFARYQRLRQETPGWWVLDFEGNPLSESELERRKKFILGGPLVIRDWEYPFAQDLIVNDSVAPDATIPAHAKVSSLIEVLRLGGPYELVHQLWSQLTLITSRVNIDVAWSRDEVFVGKFLFHVSTYICALVYWCCVLFELFQRVQPSHPLSCVRLGEGTWPVQLWVWGARLRDLGDGADMGEVHISTCFCGGVEPIQHQYHFGGYDLGQNSGCCKSRYICCASARGSACAGTSFCKLFGKWVPGEARGTPHVWSPVTEALPPAKCCIRVWEPGPVLNDGVRDKSPEGCRDSGPHGVLSCVAQAIVTNGLSMPGMVDVVANIVGVWPLVVSYLEETGHKDDGDRLVVRASTMGVLSASCKRAHHFFCWFRRKGWTDICTTISLSGWNSDCFIFFQKSFIIVVTLWIWSMLVRSGSCSVPKKCLGMH